MSNYTFPKIEGVHRAINEAGVEVASAVYDDMADDFIVNIGAVHSSVNEIADFYDIVNYYG